PLVEKRLVTDSGYILKREKKSEGSHEGWSSEKGNKRSRTIIRSPLNVYRKMWVSIKSLHIQFLKKITCVWGSNRQKSLKSTAPHSVLLGETLRVVRIDSPAFQRLGWIPDPAKECMHGVPTIQASGYVEVGN
ncbi:hypothetical protein U0070_009428, partial [Myodes glareolus]